MEKKRLKKIGSSAILLVTAIIWGFAFVAQTVGADHVGAFTFNGIRFLLGSLSLIPVIHFFEKTDMAPALKKKTLVCGSIAGVFLFSASTLQQFGIQLTGNAGKASFITGFYTVLVPVAAFFILHKKVSPFTWVGVAFAVIGLYFVCMNGGESFGLGDVLTLIATCFWTAHIVFIDYSTESVTPIRISMVQFFVCGLLSVICALIFEDISFSSVSDALLPILYGGFMSVGVAYTCQAVGQKYADPAPAAIILSTESVFGAIGGALILGERMQPRGYLGCVLIFAGIILSQITPRKSVDTVSADGSKNK